MFSNYPRYIKEILIAFKHATHNTRTRVYRVILAIIMIIGLAFCLNTGVEVAHAQTQKIEAINAFIEQAATYSSSQITVDKASKASVDTKSKQLIMEEATLLANNMQPTSEQITVLDDTRTQIELTTSSGAVVVATIDKTQDGTSNISAASINIIDRDLFTETTKTRAQQEASEEEQDNRSLYGISLPELSADALETLCSASESHEISAEAFDSACKCLSANLMLLKPSGYKLLSTEKSVGNASQNDNTATENTSNENSADNTSASASSSAKTLETYADDSGSTMTISLSSVSRALTDTSSNAEYVKTMMDSWIESSKSVNGGENAKFLVDGAAYDSSRDESPYDTSIFYATEARLWGFIASYTIADGEDSAVRHTRFGFYDAVDGYSITVTFRERIKINALIEEAAAESESSPKGAVKRFQTLFAQIPWEIDSITEPVSEQITSLYGADYAKLAPTTAKIAKSSNKATETTQQENTAENGQ